MTGAAATVDATATRPAVRLTGIRKRFGNVLAANGVDLEIAAGEFFTMLGSPEAAG
jgi:putative spermidine/putrescine transport system ATP-binding protein